MGSGFAMILVPVDRIRVCPGPPELYIANMASVAAPATLLPDQLPEFVDFVRLDAGRRLDQRRRAVLGQFFTPASIGRLMASLSTIRRDRLTLLDAGAGVGVLTAGWIARLCAEAARPTRIEVTAYELEAALLPHLESVLLTCRRVCEQVGVRMTFTIRQEDFIRSAVQSLGGGLFGSEAPVFDCAILNPPYKKFRSDSEERRLLRELGIETSNLYTAFVELALRSLRPGGELVAITPRSFCNGPYFKPFRKSLLGLASLTHVHVFDSRDSAFGDDEVLQENIIFRAERGGRQAGTVTVEWSEAGQAEHTVRRDVPFSEVVRPDDPDSFIHITPDEWGSRVAKIVRGLRGTLSSLDLQVSTGRVVDFRAKEYLRAMPESNTVPLIYPTHLNAGAVVWPKPGSKKPNALLRASNTQDQLNPSGVYVLVKRFSAKEERQRVVAALFTPESAPGDAVAFENHLNYFHRRGHGLPRALAAGLTAYLNSRLVDDYFRQFNGHTQVNAADLRKLHYPTAEQLERIGTVVLDVELSPERLDQIIEEELLNVADKAGARSATAQARIAEALDILRTLGLPREQRNERSALTLLALVGLKPGDPWAQASNTLCGVTPIMEFAAEHYGKQYAPNTRETVRRQTLHQFQDAGLVVPNPDRPDRPVNSPAYCYQVPSEVLELLHTYGTEAWDERVKEYLASAPTLAARYASEREMKRIPLRIREGLEITLSPGGHNDLLERIVTEFCPRFTPDAKLLYIGDADEKWAFFVQTALRDLGVTVETHGKMPDVVVHHTERIWLVVIEAVTSHGPVNPKRRGELKALFARSKAPLVFVTAFMSRQALNRYLSKVAWETEVWVADAPSHMIHFNGERFLGPYD